MLRFGVPRVEAWSHRLERLSLIQEAPECHQNYRWEPSLSPRQHSCLKGKRVFILGQTLLSDLPACHKGNTYYTVALTALYVVTLRALPMAREAWRVTTGTTLGKKTDPNNIYSSGLCKHSLHRSFFTYMTLFSIHLATSLSFHSIPFSPSPLLRSIFCH